MDKLDKIGADETVALLVEKDVADEAARKIVVRAIMSLIHSTLCIVLYRV